MTVKEEVLVKRRIRKVMKEKKSMKVKGKKRKTMNKMLPMAPVNTNCKEEVWRIKMLSTVMKMKLKTMKSMGNRAIPIHILEADRISKKDLSKLRKT